MNRSSVIGFFCIAQLYCATTTGEDQWAEPPPVSDADITAITTLLVDRYPEFASSAGVKASQYLQGGPDGDCGESMVETTMQGQETVREMRPNTHCEHDLATIYFLPHKENAGRAEAVMAHCRRPSIARPWPDGHVPQWDCTSVTFREYVQLEGQTCDVRLTGEMSTPALDAVRKAGLDAIHAAGKHVPEALVVYHFDGEGSGWGTFGTNECHPEISVEFSLTEGSDPAEADAWATVVMDY